MARICNDEWARLGVVSGHERQTLTLSAQALEQQARQLAGHAGAYHPGGAPLRLR
jgi:hypothetical protein